MLKNSVCFLKVKSPVILFVITSFCARDWIIFNDPDTLTRSLLQDPVRLSPYGDFYLFAYVNKFTTLPNKNPRHYRARVFVPETGFEPAHPFGRHHLKVVRLPISPPGQPVPVISGEGCKCKMKNVKFKMRNKWATGAESNVSLISSAQS